MYISVDVIEPSRTYVMHKSADVKEHSRTCVNINSSPKRRSREEEK